MKDARNVSTDGIRPADSRLFRLPLVLAALSALLAPRAAPAGTVELDLISKKGDFLPKCDPVREGRMSVTGPGIIHFDFKLDPYQSGGFATQNVPFTWANSNHKGIKGNLSGWTDFRTPPFNAVPTGVPYGQDGFFQGGKRIGMGGTDGIPARDTESFGVAAGEHLELVFRLGPVCRLYGRTWTQWAQRSHATVTFSSGGSTPKNPPPPTQQTRTIFNNGNPDAVRNRPTRGTTFSISQPTRITMIQNYHWNGGRGAAAGSISLRNQRGQTVGTWRASGKAAQGGAVVHWVVQPNVVLQPGQYTVVDSGPDTWSQNGRSGGSGMSQVEGAPAR